MVLPTAWPRTIYRSRTSSLCPCLRSRGGFLSVLFLPVARPFQCVGDLLGHVVLVMLGEHAIGLERTRWLDHPFGDHALPLAEQIGQDALIGDRDRILAVGD